MMRRHTMEEASTCQGSFGGTCWIHCGLCRYKDLPIWADIVSYERGKISAVTLLIKRIVLVVGLLLLLVSACTVVFANGSGCDECCSTAECNDCQDCHCALTTCFVLPTYASSEIYVEMCGSSHSPSCVFPDRDWYSELDRPPRFFSI